MTSKLVSFATLLVLLAGDSLAGHASTASAESAPVRFGPVIDVPAPSSGAEERASVGGQATRVELDDSDLNTTLSAWYWLAYLDGGTRLRVFEHSDAVTTLDPQSEIARSEDIGWQLANQAVGRISGSATSDELPRWARLRTGTATGPSAGLLFTLALIDALTPGELVGSLRVAGTGAIGPDGVVIPVSNVEIKVAAAMLTRPDVIFTPTSPDSIANVTVVESHHTRNPDPGHSISEWLNLSGFEHAGRDAAGHDGTTAFVVVHDVRQALAWLCGRTNSDLTCTLASNAASIPIGIQQP